MCIIYSAQCLSSSRLLINSSYDYYNNDLPLNYAYILQSALHEALAVKK